MKGPRSRAARLALDAYADAGVPRGDRLHVAVRWWTCPFPAVERVVPLHGDVLEIGCGHGLLSLYLAACSPHRRVLGVDIDVDKIALASRAADALRARDDVRVQVECRVADGAVPDGPWDAIVIADVLYLLPVELRHRLLDEAADRLAPGGVLVVKETDRHPRWKGSLTIAQELVSTQVLRITEGETVEFEPPAAFAARLRARGLEVEGHRVDRGYPHPHHLLLARRPHRGSGTVPT